MYCILLTSVVNNTKLSDKCALVSPTGNAWEFDCVHWIVVSKLSTTCKFPVFGLSVKCKGVWRLAFTLEDCTNFNKVPTGWRVLLRYIGDCFNLTTFVNTSDVNIRKNPWHLAILCDWKSYSALFLQRLCFPFSTVRSFWIPRHSFCLRGN